MRIFSGLAAILLASPVMAAAPPDAIVALWASVPAQRGEIAEAMPIRFALRDDGTVYVGGTSEIASARLEKKDIKAIEKQLDRVRKLPIFTEPQTLGPGDGVYRLSIRKSGDVIARGDPARAAGNLRPLALLIETLLAFDHPSLRPFAASTLLAAARETPLPGGCRSWTFAVPLADVLKEPRAIPATQAAGWPSGGTPAVVCSAGRRYAVTLRPLVPGETP